MADWLTVGPVRHLTSVLERLPWFSLDSYLYACVWVTPAIGSTTNRVVTRPASVSVPFVLLLETTPHGSTVRNESDVTGMFTNCHSDGILRRLRRPGETGYKIPRGVLW